MTTLQNPFEFVGSPARPTEEAAASVPLPMPPRDAAADLPNLDEIDCIGEIFRGARKLETVPDIFEFDPDAITAADRLLYDVLKAMVDPHAPGLPEIPDEDALFEALEPLPLFLQIAS